MKVQFQGVTMKRKPSLYEISPILIYSWKRISMSCGTVHCGTINPFSSQGTFFTQKCGPFSPCFQGLQSGQQFRCQGIRKAPPKTIPGWTLRVDVRPLKTNMTSWKITIFNRKYIFIHGGCSIVMLVFGLMLEPP